METNLKRGHVDTNILNHFLYTNRENQIKKTFTRLANSKINQTNFYKNKVKRYDDLLHEEQKLKATHTKFQKNLDELIFRNKAE